MPALHRAALNENSWVRSDDLVQVWELLIPLFAHIPFSLFISMIPPSPKHSWSHKVHMRLKLILFQNSMFLKICTQYQGNHWWAPVTGPLTYTCIFSAVWHISTYICTCTFRYLCMTDSMLFAYTALKIHNFHNHHIYNNPSYLN